MSLAKTGLPDLVRLPDTTQLLDAALDEALQMARHVGGPFPLPVLCTPCFFSIFASSALSASLAVLLSIKAAWARKIFDAINSGGDSSKAAGVEGSDKVIRNNHAARMEAWIFLQVVRQRVLWVGFELGRWERDRRLSVLLGI